MSILPHLMLDTSILKLFLQVKVNGYRIELSEIETVLESHPDVLQAVVVVRGSSHPPELVAFVIVGKKPKSDISKGDHVDAFVEEEEEPPLDRRSLRTFAGRTLTKYMLPR